MIALDNSLEKKKVILWSPWNGSSKMSVRYVGDKDNP